MGTDTLIFFDKDIETMKLQKVLLSFCLASAPFFTLAEDEIKASDLSKPPAEEPSKAAQKRARKRVEVKKAELQKKIKQGASAEEIGKAKARVQIDRTESNRQDYLNEVKDKPKAKEEK